MTAIRSASISHYRGSIRVTDDTSITRLVLVKAPTYAKDQKDAVGLGHIQVFGTEVIEISSKLHWSTI